MCTCGLLWAGARQECMISTTFVTRVTERVHVNARVHLGAQLSDMLGALCQLLVVRVHRLRIAGSNINQLIVPFHGSLSELKSAILASGPPTNWSLPHSAARGRQHGDRALKATCAHLVLACVYSCAQKTQVCGGSAAILDSEDHICCGVPSNRRPQPMRNSVSPCMRQSMVSAIAHGASLHSATGRPW
jgi:hypothetical protein